MSLTALLAVLPPPRDPSETGDQAGWAELGVNLGVDLPADYHEFIAAYGTGYIAGFLWVFNPFSADSNVNFGLQTKQRIDAHRTFRGRFPKMVPFRLFPEEGGLLPFGATDNGDVMFWLTEGPADGWKTVVYASRADEFEVFGLEMTEFLARVLGSSIRCRIFPSDFPSGDVSFAPWLPPSPSSQEGRL